MPHRLRRRDDINKETLRIEDDEKFREIEKPTSAFTWIRENNTESYLNRGWTAYTGKSIQDPDQGRFKNTYPNDVKLSVETIQNAFNAQVSFEIKYRLKYQSGDYRWVLERGTPIFNHDGDFRGMIGGVVDIDTQKKIENKLEVSEERYRRLFETARDGILILNSDTGEITDVNPFLEELTGYTKEEFIGKKLWDFGVFKNITTTKEIFKILQDTGYVRYENLPLETKDGIKIEVGFVSNVYIAGNERVIQCNIRDLSEQKRVIAADKALDLLKQEQSKTSFIADVTHELRTPLAVIKGNIELAVRNKHKEEELEETFKAINVEIDHLAEMLSNLSILTSENQDFYRKVEKDSVDLKELIEDVVKRLKKVSVRKHITINLEDLPSISILGSETYLEKLFSNIIGNAIFYGKEDGTIVIKGKKAGGMVNISVADDGIGIAKEDIPKLFERFYRTEHARATNREGTGLGLAISKWVAEAHQGKIDVQSEVGKGTTFTIRIPLFE